MMQKRKSFKKLSTKLKQLLQGKATEEIDAKFPKETVSSICINKNDELLAAKNGRIYIIPGDTRAKLGHRVGSARNSPKEALFIINCNFSQRPVSSDNTAVMVTFCASGSYRKAIFSQNTCNNWLIKSLWVKIDLKTIFS